MAFWVGRDRVALGLGPERVRLVVGRGNGTVSSVWSGSREIPAGALGDGLRAPVLRSAGVVDGAVMELVGEARGAGHLRRRPELVSVVVADGSMRIATTPLDGDAPGAAEGAHMARWLLRELLPVEPDAIRADWSILEGVGDGEPARWLLSVGAEAELLDEYEGLVQRLGWTAARIVPWTFAAAVAVSRESDEATRRLLLCESDGALACLFEADGIPRFHRSWRTRVDSEQLDAELPALRRYVNDHLEMALGTVSACGSPEWAAVAATACREAGLTASVLAPEDALLGALTT